MAIYVDELINYGVRYGRAGPEWCHMATDGDLDDLHRFALRIGLQKRWFQGPPKHRHSHYDLTRNKREAAIKAGAIPLDRKAFADLIIANAQRNKQ